MVDLRLLIITHAWWFVVVIASAMAAEQTINSVASAVTSELTGRALSGLIGKFGKQATVDVKLQRLEMLLIKIHSAVEASEKHAVENTWLIRWRDKLKDATSEGDQVLASFRSRASDAQAAAGNADKPHDGASSSTTSTASPATATATGTALSFTRIALSGMAQGIHSARMMLFPSEDEGMERLNATVEKLGQLPADIGEFVRQPRRRRRRMSQSQPRRTPPRRKRRVPRAKSSGSGSCRSPRVVIRIASPRW